mgnify:CR=1 FL=1
MANDPKREEIYGSNKRSERKGVSYWYLIWIGMHDFTMILLTISATISIILGIKTEGWDDGWYDGIAIIAAILVCLNVSAINDLQKDKQFRALNALNNRRNIKVLRNGTMLTVVTDDLVVGDIVQISAGDTIPADGIYIRGNNLKMDESKLTGESDQVEKGTKNPFIVSSTECHEGSLTMLVTAVGPNSVFGRMKTMIEGDNEDSTPLQQKLSVLATQISVLGAVVGILTVVVMIAKHVIAFASGKGNQSWTVSDWSYVVKAFITGVTILVVAIPEGLPLAVTIALAYSVKRMMKDNNLVRHLSACETMGGANTICSDKTGTLTQNQMTVVQGWVYRRAEEDQTQLLNELKSGDQKEYDAFIQKCKEIPEALRELLLDDALLNNEAFLTTNADGREVGVGSAIEVAMLKWARLLGVDYTQKREACPQLKEAEQDAEHAEHAEKEETGKTGIVKMYPFHSNRKRSSCLVRLPDGRYRLLVKGAPEMVIRLCDRVMMNNGELKELTGSFQEDAKGALTGEGSRMKLVKYCIYPMARQALRVLAFAYRDFDAAQDWDAMVQYATEEQKGVGDCPAVEDKLTLLAFLGFQDPVRPEVPDAVLVCQKAGIFVRMVTGDNMETAKAIARQCNIYHNDEWKDSRGRKWPAGRAILGSQFREVVGGLVLPPHFYHECHCKDCSNDKYFVKDYKTPAYPTHFGYPSIVGHMEEHCKDWTAEALAKRGEGKSQCTKECKERGCMYQVKNPHDARQLQQFMVVKNQGQFDQFVDTLQVMARSAPTDKHLLVTGLMERHQVVAVTGDGTNDGPALAKSNVGFAMGITGTSVAKDASDIVLMDDNFVSIVKAVMWGRNVYDSIRKFLQFQLTVSFVACAVSFISALLLEESPLTAVQVLWINLAMDTLAALSLATESPTPKLLDRAPYGKNESLISNVIVRNLLVQVFFHVPILLTVVFYGHKMFNLPVGLKLGYGHTPTEHYTMVFNIFVCLELFNEFNSRRINDEVNVFEGIFQNPMFWTVFVVSNALQIVMIQFFGTFFTAHPLSMADYAFSIALGFFSLPLYQLARTVPASWFVGVGGKKEEAFPNTNSLLDARIGLSRSSLRSVTSTQFMNHPSQIPNLFSSIRRV